MKDNKFKIIARNQRMLEEYSKHPNWKMYKEFFVNADIPDRSKFYYFKLRIKQLFARSKNKLRGDI